jgi:hypothetical protein
MASGGSASVKNPEVLSILRTPTASRQSLRSTASRAAGALPAPE